MKFEYRFSEDLDVEENFLTPTDVKQYVFCPRVTYFTRVVQIRPIMSSQQPDAKKDHVRIADHEKRRRNMLKQSFPFTVAKRKFELFFRSPRLQVHGKVDMLVITNEGEYIPVEFKAMVSKNRQVRLDHKYQLAVIALLIEDHYDTIVRRGYLHYMKDEQTVQVFLTEGVKRRAQVYLRRIRDLLDAGVVPEPRRECRYSRVGCGFADQCRDL
ncbi:MAG: CRISPR-associated protein Cas4 [Candidatus Thorarchaeota archaeon]|nr:CRISPR-associated protein Cas4 [Candidatus Thorarchaeota archaeon]